MRAKIVEDLRIKETPRNDWLTPANGLGESFNEGVTFVLEILIFQTKVARNASQKINILI